MSLAAPSPAFESRIPFGEATRLLRRLWRYVRPYRSKFFLGLLLLLLSVPLGQFAIFLTRDVTNQALNATSLTSDERWAVVVRVITLQALFWLASNLLSVCREVLEWYVSMRSTFDLRLAFYKHLLRLPMASLSRRAPGEHLFRATSDMVSMFRVGNKVETSTPAGQLPPENKEVQSVFWYSNDVDPFDPGIMGIVSRSMPLFLETLYALGWGAALLYLIDPVLSLCLVFYIVPFAWVSSRAFNRVRRSAHAFKTCTENEYGVLRDSIAGLRWLKSFGREKLQLGKYFQAASATRRRGVGMQFELVRTQQFLQQGMRWVFTASIYLYQAKRIVDGQATIGDWVATALLLEAAQMPLQNFVQLTQLIKMQLVPAQRVLETLDEEPTLVDRPDAVAIGPLEGSIQFSGASLSYTGERAALRGIDLDIQPGEYIGIVGPSGAGKSSLIALALRMYGADEGAVRIDGVDVRDAKRDSFLDQIGVVPQQTFLYSGTLEDNVRFGDPWASQEEFDAAARLSGADEFVARQADGWATEVGDGLRISGGERQRLGIARALLRNPKVLFLDEATASLDPKTEHAILCAIDQVREGRTVISVAHRLKAVANCDRVVVMQDGRIVQQGTHEELLAREGLYRSLWIEQNGEAEGEAR